MTIVDLIGKLPTHPLKTYPTRDPEKITRLVLHHAAGLETQTPRQIARFHVDEREWPGIAYHYLVGPAGEVFKCWPTSTVTWCVAGGNSPSLCVCLIGNRHILPPAASQWDAVVELFQVLLVALPDRAIYGHREIADPPQSTVCPGQHISMSAFRAAVRTVVV